MTPQNYLSLAQPLEIPLDCYKAAIIPDICLQINRTLANKRRWIWGKVSLACSSLIMRGQWALLCRGTMYPLMFVDRIRSYLLLSLALTKCC